MELMPKDIKFLTIMNETRLTNGKMFGRYFEEVSEQFKFSNSELNTAVKKLVKMDMLSVIDAGGKDMVYFHTDKVSKDQLDKELMTIRH